MGKFVDRVADYIFVNILGNPNDASGGFRKTASRYAVEIEKMVEEMLPEDDDDSERGNGGNQHLISKAEGFNSCLAEIRRRLKGGV